MNKLILMALCLAVLGPACRRKRVVPIEPPSEGVASAPAQAQTEPKTKGGSPPPAVDSIPTAPPDSSLRLPIHQELTGAVHLYLNDHQKLPSDFATLVRERYLPALPKPPTGKRFALDRNRTQVVIID